MYGKAQRRLTGFHVDCANHAGVDKVRLFMTKRPLIWLSVSVLALVLIGLSAFAQPEPPAFTDDNFAFATAAAFQVRP